MNRVRPTSKSNYILQNLYLYPLPIPKAVGIDARYRNAKAYALTTYPMQTPLNPLWPSVQNKWNNRTDTLWWSAVAHKDLQSKSTVRRWAARRVRAAFEQSLKKKGYASDGSPIEGSKHTEPLYGSLQMSSKSKSIGVRIEQLEKETDVIVEEIIKRQVNGPYCEDLGSTPRKKKKT